ncbi:hypothetical protein K466DRAFT_666397 [Polyporus arcularius HHB13444]|uniref:Uncharacterized protein n=1 Tax=Polyporus arcularius HHB13444 TaxID=1314778 RepID=A0A5C3P0V1_9APHY|nr:hypothetical protein K466DRAFT_666397 [Polyporus arcularius HHB13444]
MFPDFAPSNLPCVEEAFYLVDYVNFKPYVDKLLADTTISDAELEVRARKHLKVLDDPRCVVFNRPYWTTDASGLDQGDFSTKRAFEAMYATADDLGLEHARRYVSACILLSNRSAKSPFPVSNLSNAKASGTTTPLDVICDPTLPRHSLLCEWTIDFAKHYLGIDLTSMKVDSPRLSESLLLDRCSDALFGYLWNLSLRHTEIAHQYRMAESMPTEKRKAREGDAVTVVDHIPVIPPATGLRSYVQAIQEGIWGLCSSYGFESLGSPNMVTLPSQDALRMHAAYASFMHQSGMLSSPAGFRRNLVEVFDQTFTHGYY